MAGKIVIVDDERDMLILLKRIISEGTDHEVFTFSNPSEALKWLKNNPVDLVFTDLKMPKMDGIQFLKAIKRARPRTCVIIVTAYATIETAVEAIKMGAYDYISKPFKRERILLMIDKALKWTDMVKENLALRRVLAETGNYLPLVGTTPVMREICERIRQVAPTTATILITGATGTGKELVARAIHQNSLRKAKKFVAVNCATLPENVTESELFGHVKGAFTGAWRDKKGLVEEADGGTLFLRFLQEGEYRPVGANITKHADVRIIAATNHDLTKEIKEKRFREDLYYRLNVVRFDLPPLAARREDIPLLVYYFLKKYSRIYQKDVREISPLAIQILVSHEYPGNVRELENIIERSVIFCRSTTLKAEDLLIENKKKTFFPDLSEDISHLSYREAREIMVRRFHKQYFHILLQETGGNVTKAAEVAGIKRQYLYRLIKESGIDNDEFRAKQSNL
ncbi:MAG: sigma-54-dependent Fis family transcriptional regulator [Deltaproteobacteria bacterium]|nr:sigma-54-dependent Fis family transcriptional regulator [Deltaproteobacteria bacterium]